MRVVELNAVGLILNYHLWGEPEALEMEKYMNPSPSQEQNVFIPFPPTKHLCVAPINSQPLIDIWPKQSQFKKRTSLHKHKPKFQFNGVSVYKKLNASGFEKKKEDKKDLDG